MAQLDNLDFLNLNALRNYPVRDDMSRISTDGGFTIANDFIVDLQLAATYDPTRRFYISRISNFEDQITVELSDQNNTVAGTFVIDTTQYTQFQDVYFTPTSSYVGATGVLVVGWLDGIRLQPTGNFLFTLGTAELEARAIIPALQGINRIIFKNADGSSFALTGDIEILARTNLRFSNPDDDNRIVIDAGENLGLNTDCGVNTNCIKTINGIPPEEDGDFTLDFSDCATLTPIPANTGLLLQDICCKPCTGCNDIEELTNRLTSTETQLLALRTYYQTLTDLFESYKLTVTYTCNCQGP